jgi:hypothetical protein
MLRLHPRRLTEYTCSTRRLSARHTLSKDIEKARRLYVVSTLSLAQIEEWSFPLEGMVSCVYGMTARVPPRSRVRGMKLAYRSGAGQETFQALTENPTCDGPAVPYEGEQRALLSCDVSIDGLTVAAGTELRGEDAHIVYWCVRISHIVITEYP